MGAQVWGDCAHVPQPRHDVGLRAGGPFGAYTKTYNDAVVQERGLWYDANGVGKMPLWRYFRAVGKACRAAFERDLLRASFTHTIFSTCGDDTVTTSTRGLPTGIEGVTELPALPRIKLDCEAVVARCLKQAAEGFKPADHVGNEQDCGRARQAQRQQGYRRTSQELSKVAVDLMKQHGHGMPAGCQVEIETEGEFVGQNVCVRCREQDAARAQRRGHDFGGGTKTHRQGYLDVMEKSDEKEAAAATKLADRLEREKKAAAAAKERQDKVEKQAAQDDVLDGIMGRTLEKQEMIDALTEAVGGKTRAASDRVKVAKDVIDELKAKLKEEEKAKAKKEKEAAKKKENVARLLREDAKDERADTKA